MVTKLFEIHTSVTCDPLQDILWCLWKIQANTRAKPRFQNFKKADGSVVRHCDQLVAELNARVELGLVLDKVETGVWYLPLDADQRNYLYYPGPPVNLH